jgi:steroid 5-alpha reductase family enzyme
VRVSTVAMLERFLRQTRSGYADYAARASTFFPWFPKVK